MLLKWWPSSHETIRSVARSIQFTFAGFTLQVQLKASTNTQIHRYNRVTQTKQKNTKTDKVNQE
jgi:hypothetical protein